ncbi:outer dynein arm-docking complex subunit 3-like [Styela clava]|uniref:coiled-coil domain-containing protein 151-like n=1 Tax=Styela clava TaxID=7725 RepID=UPI00193AAA29|nr:coiled-coil domain-containing protein 151-like [Styela clava]
MRGQSGMHKPPIQEQISEITKKISLLEGDRKAYYESSQWSIKKNREIIARMRQENKTLHKTLADLLAGDDKVIDEAFEGRHVERAALRNKSGKTAIMIIDQKVCDSKKRLNALKSTSEARKRKLNELQTQHDQMVKDKSAAEELDKGESESAQHLRQLENRLDKARLKSQEADHISKVYEKIKAHLQQESLTFHNQLDAQEADILKTRHELKEVQSMYSDAQVARDDAKEELARHEAIVYKERKEREEALAELKLQAEEKKAHAERVERRMQRAALGEQELGQEGQKPALTEEEQEKKITTFEEAFIRIKEATGVSDVQEVVDRFRSQGETQKHLEELKANNKKQLDRLKEEKEKLQQEYEEMKYSGEAKLSNGQRMLEEFEQHLMEEQQRRDDAAEKLERASGILVSVKAGVEHLADKLQHLKTMKSHVPTAHLSPSSDEYVLDLLSISEEKLLKLLEELDGRQLADILRQMEEEEFHSSIEGKLPPSNTRINLPAAQKHDAYEDEDAESGEDDTGAPTRDALKRRSQQIVDTKLKKGRSRPRKKKGKN